MNRKLHNTVTALFATSGLLALSLMAANPLPREVAAKPAPAIQLGQVEVATLAAVAGAIGQAEAAKAEAAATARPARRSHRGRQSVAMPFFSFFPKG
jgi:hypothetical protein